MTQLPKAKMSVLPVIALSLAAAVAPDPASAGMDAYIGEVLRIANAFCPRGTLEAQGQIMSIASNTALFSLLGTNFGGNGQTTFALPDLRGRSPINVGSSFVVGETGGQETQTLVVSQMAAHSHAVNATNADGNMGGPGDKLLASALPDGVGQETIYSNLPPNRTMSPSMISIEGSGQPFSVLDPYIVIRYCVVTQGIYPSRP